MFGSSLENAVLAEIYRRSQSYAIKLACEIKFIPDQAAMYRIQLNVVRVIVNATRHKTF